MVVFTNGLLLGEIRQLYDVERAVRDADDEQRRAARQAGAKPKVNGFFDWFRQQQRRVLPRTPTDEFDRLFFDLWQPSNVTTGFRIDSWNGYFSSSLSGVWSDGCCSAGSSAGASAVSIALSGAASVGAAAAFCCWELISAWITS